MCITLSSTASPLDLFSGKSLSPQFNHICGIGFALFITLYRVTNCPLKDKRAVPPSVLSRCRVSARVRAGGSPRLSIFGAHTLIYVHSEYVSPRGRVIKLTWREGREKRIGRHGGKSLEAVTL